MSARAMAPIMALALAGCATRSTALSPPRRAAIADSVRTMLAAWRDAFNARDFARASSFYSDSSDFRWFENGDLKFHSAAQLRDTMLAEAATFRSLNMSLGDADVTPLAPGVAAVTATFTEMVADTAGQTMGFAGAVTATVIDEATGWRFLTGHTSMLLPSLTRTARHSRRGT
ncbi:MAG: nuclear transport factor 2 family protein [Gemmatimonadales bacterium]